MSHARHRCSKWQRSVTRTTATCDPTLELAGDDPRTHHTNTTPVATGTAEDDAGKVHIDKVEFDVGTEDQMEGDAKTIAKTVTDHKDSDSEYKEQIPNTVDSVAGMQKSITEPDDKQRCVGDRLQYDNDGSSNVRN